MFGRVLLEVLQGWSPLGTLLEDFQELKNIISSIGDDHESNVRTELVEQIPHIAMICRETGNPELINLVNMSMLDVVLKYLSDPENLVRKTAQAALLVLVDQSLVDRSIIEERICPAILELSRIDSVMDFHTSAVALMSKLAPLLGRQSTENLFLQRFAELCSNDVFYVRKVCASNFGEFCAVVGQQATEEILLPKFTQLCTDDVWGVRKACAEVITTVSFACSARTRRGTLANVFVALLEDSSRWVRTAAFQTLGPFISTFAEPKIIGLAYNQHGELVLTNTEGTEHKIQCPSLIPYTESRMTINQLYETLESPHESNSLANMVIAHTNKENNYISYSGNSQVNTVDAEKTDQSSSDKDEKESENAVINTSDNNCDHTGTVKIEEQEQEQIIAKPCSPCKSKAKQVDDLSSIIKRAIENKQQEQQQNFGICNNQIPETGKIQITSDNQNSFLPDVVKTESSSTHDHMVLDHKSEHKMGNHSETSVSSSCTTEGIVDGLNKNLHIKSENKGRGDASKWDEGCLDSFNSNQYWYISPEMPLDIDLLADSKIESVPEVKDDVKKDMSEMDTLCRTVLDHLQTTNIFATCNKMFNSDFSMKFNEDAKNFLATNSNIMVQQDIVPQALIKHFVSMVDPYMAQQTDNEAAHHCAFSLPAVALTLGEKNWPLLKRTYETLASDLQWKVRKTVASSMHEVANILGEAQATKDLVPIFEAFIKDLDEVRIGVLKHMAQFFKLIRHEERSRFLPKLCEFLKIDNNCNWRFRLEVAQQLLFSVELFTPAECNKHIKVLAILLLTDKVVAVRKMAIELVTALVKHFSPDTPLTCSLLVQLAEQFAHSTHWSRRQTFAILCGRLVAEDAIPMLQLELEVLTHLLDLSWDPIPNVRLATAKTLVEKIANHEYFSKPSCNAFENIQTVIRRLQSDKDRDVRYFSKSPEQLEESTASEEVSAILSMC